VAAGGDDGARYLAVDLVRAYTSNPFQSVLSEGQALDEHEQQRMTQLALRRDRERRLVVWRETHTTISVVLGAFLELAGLEPAVRRHARALEHHARAIDRALGA
jgi:hypothetical protein